MQWGWELGRVLVVELKLEHYKHSSRTLVSPSLVDRLLIAANTTQELME